jgi:CRISPR-associated protein Cas5d
MKDFCLEVWGDYACFTRPEMKAERVSYDVITPSSARAVFESILWKPAIVWNITNIEVLNPIRWIYIKRNEISSKAGTNEYILADSDTERQQRSTLCLKDVRYRIYANFDFIEPENRCNNKRNILCDYTREKINREHAGADEKPEKYAAMFERRAGNGQCFSQPYLGCREFSANFRLIAKNDIDQERERKPAVEETRELGLMLYDMDFTSLDAPSPLWFFAKMISGVVNIPAWDSKEVLR